jgi:membrane protein implicated in regulation of membrane protease activity
MIGSRQALSYLAVADVVLFLIASAFNNPSATSVDGIVWWIALFVFLLLIMAGVVVSIQFLRSRAKRPKRVRRH